jgi:hypothetical protein
MAEAHPHDEILAMVRRQAAGVLELPAAEREARYALIRRCFYEAAKKHGRSEEHAAAWGEKVEAWVRTWVGAAESGEKPGDSG